MKSPLFIIALCGNMLLISFFVTAVKWPAPIQRPPTQAEISKDLITTIITPGTIIVTFESPKQIIATCKDNLSEACSIESYAPSFYFPFKQVNVCHIYIPTGGMLAGEPSDQKSAWMDHDTRENLAHEMFHCFRGNWHQTWTTMDKLENSK